MGLLLFVFGDNVIFNFIKLLKNKIKNFNNLFENKYNRGGYIGFES